MTTQKRPKYIMIAALMLLLFNYPLLSTANKRTTISGIPLLYIYLSVVWIAGVVVLYFISAADKSGNHKTDE